MANEKLLTWSEVATTQPKFKYPGNHMSKCSGLLLVAAKGKKAVPGIAYLITSENSAHHLEHLKKGDVIYRTAHDEVINEPEYFLEVEPILGTRPKAESTLTKPKEAE